MKRHYGVWALLLCVTCVSTSWGASVPGGLSTDYLSSPTWVERCVIGADFERVGRTVDPDVGEDVALDIYAYSLFLGYDISPVVTVFGTVGGTDDQATEENSAGGGSGIKFSGGINLNLARYDLRHPPILANDRVTVKTVAEVAHYDADNTEWWQGTLALPIAFEIVERDRVQVIPDEERLVLALYFGPQIGFANGALNQADGDNDFDAAEMFGFTAGLDLYMTQYASIGAHVDFWDSGDDNISGGASLRYHF